MKSFKDLPAADARIIMRCVSVILGTNLIEDWEFQTRLGFTRAEGRLILEGLADVDLSEGTAANRMINNCLNEVCHGIRVPEQELTTMYAISREEAKSAFDQFLHYCD